MNANLFDILARSISDPDKTAIETGSGEITTYADLVAETGRFANALKALGVKPGDRVAAQIEKSVEAIVLYLATVRAGGVFLPLNTGYTPAEIEYFLGDAEPAVFVCDPSRYESLKPIATATGAQVLTLDADGEGILTEAAARESDAFETVERSADDLAALLYTSGTTGRSKGAMLTHGNLVSNAEALRETWRYTADDVLIHALPIFHTHGLFVATNVTLFSGASMLFLPRFDVDKVFELLPRATRADGGADLLRAPAAGRLADRGGDAAHAALRLRLGPAARRNPPRVEGPHRPRDPRALRHDRDQHERLEPLRRRARRRYGRLPAAGGRDPGHRSRKAARSSPPGEIGMIEVRGPNVFKGYWRMPEKTAAELRDDGFFITGDLGKFDERGYLHIVGRGKDLIITGGYNVYPKEIETEIDAIPGVVESAVVGVPHRDFGEGVTAVVVTTGKADLTEADVLKSAGAAPRQVQAAEARDLRRRVCRATPWARCRRTCCARPTATSTTD